ncbi:unnamed protein product [Paramecium primaurelia]|uniref:Uncharacterized protein n=1 Tax=Paramecium primaurelia TaxID=5886 RepID=A0A8S1KLM8_PARPR|nr:unnamed protein product [Paramecium primaurelia]
MEFERITVTKRGIEVQQQLKQILGVKESKQFGTIRKKEYSENLLRKQKEQEIHTSSFLEPILDKQEQMNVFLTNRFTNRQKFIKKEMEKFSQKKTKFGGSFQSESHRSFKCLDFRQMQYLKSKYTEGFFLTKQNQQFKMLSKPQGQEMHQREDKQLEFKQAKFERMLRKHEQFNLQTQSIPTYEKGIKREPNFMSELVKQMEKREISSRVESIKEINQKFGNSVDLLEYNCFSKERFQETISNVHFNKYEKLWKTLRVGK